MARGEKRGLNKHLGPQRSALRSLQYQSWDRLPGAWLHHAWVSSAQNSTGAVPVPLQRNWFCVLVRKFLCWGGVISGVVKVPVAVRVRSYKEQPGQPWGWGHRWCLQDLLLCPQGSRRKDYH